MSLIHNVSGRKSKTERLLKLDLLVDKIVVSKAHLFIEMNFFVSGKITDIIQIK